MDSESLLARIENSDGGWLRSGKQRAASVGAAQRQQRAERRAANPRPRGLPLPLWLIVTLVVVAAVGVLAVAFFAFSLTRGRPLSLTRRWLAAFIIELLTRRWLAAFAIELLARRWLAAFTIELLTRRWLAAFSKEEFAPFHRWIKSHFSTKVLHH